MRHSLTKIIAAALSIIMLVCCFAGCTQGAEGKCTVTFNYNDAETVSSYVQVDSGETVTAPQNPTRENYTFGGWSTNALGTDDFDFATPITSDIRLFAKWTLAVATVKFISDGSVFKSVNVNVGGNVQLPEETPQRDEYRFDGWYLGSNSVYEFDASKPVTENITVYAKWLQTSARVTFRLYGNEVYKSEVVEIETTVERPEDPQREDYVFTGWYDSQACVNGYDFDKPVKKNTTIYAGWQLVTASITLDYGYDVENGIIKEDVDKQLSKPTDPVREGYTFTGWYVNSDLTEEYNFNQIVKDNFTLYAGWEINKYTATFNDGYSNAVISTQDVLYGETVSVPDSDPVRSGYEFIGWYTDSAATKEYDFESPVKGNLTLYAGWQSSGDSTGNIVVNFYMNDGTSQVVKTVTLTSAGRITSLRPNDPERKGYYFAGWSRNAEGTDTFNFSSTVVRSSTNLYAKWLKGYAFEAEYTNLTGKHGQGLSLNCEGPDGLIKGPNVTQDIRNHDEAKVSNGHFVGNLFYTGAYIDFEINAEEAVTGAVLVLRLSPDIHDMILTENEYQVVVNGTALTQNDGYTGLSLTGAFPEAGSRPDGTAIVGEHEKRPFENYTITVSLNLNKGHNTIRLYTNNAHDHGATFNADTPLVDCMYIYSSVALTWYECHPENVKQSASDITYEIVYG